MTTYLYHSTQTWHTKYQDGRETTVFSNGQTEVTPPPPPPSPFLDFSEFSLVVKSPKR